MIQSEFRIQSDTIVIIVHEYLSIDYELLRHQFH